MVSPGGLPCDLTALSQPGRQNCPMHCWPDYYPLFREVEWYQALRDGILDRNPARVTGWQREYQRAENELDDPRSLALADWEALERLAAALVARSYGHYQGWGDAVEAAAYTAARIGEISGVRYLHPGQRSITDAGDALTAHLSVRRSPNGPHLRVV